MRSSVAFVLVTLALAGAGWAALNALGYIRPRPRELIASFGLAYLCGVAIVIPVLIAMLTIGIPLNLATAALATIAIVLALAFGRERLRFWLRIENDETEPTKPAGPPAWVAKGLIGLLSIFLVVATFAFARITHIADAADIWGIRALALFHYDHLIPEVFANPLLAALDYPLLVPVLEAVVYRAMGTAQVVSIGIEHWLIFACFVWALCFMLHSRQGWPLWFPVVLVLALAPGVYHQVVIGYADVPVACFVGLGALAAGLWLVEPRPAHAALAALMLAAAVNTKNEGLLGATLVLFAAALAMGLRGTRKPPELLAGAGAVIVILAASALPWRVWTRFQGIGVTDHIGDERDADQGIGTGEYLQSGVLPDPGYLADHLPNLDPGVAMLISRVADTHRWSWLVVAFLAIAVLSVVVGQNRRLATFYLACATGFFAGHAYVYWTASHNLRLSLESAHRTTTTIVFLSAVGAAHLLATHAGRSPPKRSRG